MIVLSLGINSTIAFQEDRTKFTIFLPICLQSIPGASANDCVRLHPVSVEPMLLQKQTKFLLAFEGGKIFPCCSGAFVNIVVLTVWNVDVNAAGFWWFWCGHFFPKFCEFSIFSLITLKIGIFGKFLPINLLFFGLGIGTTKNGFLLLLLLQGTGWHDA